jgi:hypothetical protein
MPLPVARIERKLGGAVTGQIMEPLSTKIRGWQTTIEHVKADELSLSEIDTIMDELYRELYEFKPSEDKDVKALRRTLEEAVQATKRRLNANITRVDCAQSRRPDAHE